MKKNILQIVFSLLLFVSLGTVKVFADETFIVVLDGGSYGAFETGASVELTCKYGDQISVGSSDESGVIINQITKDENNETVTNSYKMTVTNTKYFLRGLHTSGHEDELDYQSHIIKKPTTIVADYSSSANRVQYKIQYLHIDTREPLAEERTMFGVPGSKPVVAYQYIEGYQPQAYQLTGTIGTKPYQSMSSDDIPELNDDSEDTVVFTFLYTPLSGGTAGTIDIDDGTEYIYEEGGPTGGGTGGGAGGGGAAPAPEPSVPEEIIDIDEPEVPQTEPENNGSENNQGNEETIEPEPVPTTSFWETLMHNPWLLAGTLGGSALLIAFLILLFGKRRGNAE